MRRSAGFTLIEVLVALLVFALVATAATQVGSQYISSYERIRDKTMATWIADNRMNELRLSETYPGISESTDDLDFGPYRWRVLTAIKGTEDPLIRRVEVTVYRYIEERSEPLSIYTLTGFVGEPRGNGQ
ncbi:type II secretion system minor pseudopilin GspI [Marinobacter zhejiangensis]|uniref:Type II secretion system protein I n=1 Tax=Marinobacter zhejiangensis TaxID=488535 RepID=A0A1I4PDR9_9GAMM|nr:type II secretion system minor pseudopilin GspI [Marinobacter zhejiangensis]SFM25840.1 general secretion pathway protein I [Marinobacter zhejiangensis]